jgi:O-glycosyl hydrolase
MRTFRFPYVLLTLLLVGVTGCRASVATPFPTETPSPTATARPTSTPLPSPSPTPSVVTISIDPAVRYQTMDGIGANSYAFPYANDIGWNWEAVKYVFDELDIAYIRLAPWLGWWETANDNDDPYTINWDGFGTVNDIINNHDVPFAQFLRARGIELSVGVWDFAGVSEWCETCEDWLASGRPRQIPPELYPELGESIAAYILNMQNHGVPIAFAEVQNEPDIEAGIRYPNPEALRDAGRIVLEQSDHFDLKNVQLHAPNLHAPINNVPWIDAWFADEVLRERTVAVSYHTWWSVDRKNYEAIWEAAQKYGKPVWATETGYQDTSIGIAPQKWRSAWEYGKSFYRAIAWSHASRVYLWTILGNDAAVGKDGERYPMFYVFKHFTNYIPAGAVLVDSQSDDAQVLSLVFARPDGTYTVILLNDNRMERVGRLAGMSTAIVEAVTTTEGAYERATALDAEGALFLPPLSVTSLVLRP